MYPEYYKLSNIYSPHVLHDRWKAELEEEKEREASPAFMFSRYLKGWHFQETEGAYKIYYNKAVVGLESYRLMGEPRISYGYNCLIRFLYVMPNHRRNGVAVQIIKYLTQAADETGCVLTAVCVPFDISWGLRNMISKEDKDYEDGVSKCECISRSITEYESDIKYLDMTKKENKSKRKRQKKRFLDCGFRRVVVSENMKTGEINRFKNWTLAYVPNNCPEPMKDFIIPKLR